MFPNLWFRWLKQLPYGKTQRCFAQAERRRCLFRPQIECLEDRLTPAMLFVNTHADPANPTHGMLSLREAITEANAATKPDTIVLSAGKYTISNPAPSADFVITNSMTIMGQGAGVTTVDGAGVSERIFDVQELTNVPITVTFADMSLRHGGNTQSDGGAIQTLSATINVVNCTVSDNIGLQGGAINDQNGNVTLNGSTLSRNVAQDAGGGIYAGGTLTLKNSVVRVNSTLSAGGGIFAGTATLMNSTVSDNQAVTSGGGIAASTVNLAGSTVTDNSSGGFGGGISCSTPATYAAVNLTGSTVSGNFAQTSGGGIYLPGGFSQVTLKTCILDGNYAANGGAVFAGVVLCVNTNISGNYASGASNPPADSPGGGGIWAEKIATLSGCTVTDNVANGDGGGIYSGSAELTDCAVSGNYARAAPGGGGGQGGGVWSYDVSLYGCTISGNVAAGDGGGIYSPGPVLTNCTVSGNFAVGSGGGIAFGPETVSAGVSAGSFLFDTIAENRAGSGGGGVDASQVQGGTFSLEDTIIALNLVSASGSDPDLAGSFTSFGHNLIGILGPAASGSTIPSDEFGNPANPLLPGLSALGNHGGPTQTYALLPGSKAAGAGANVLVTELSAKVSAQATTLPVSLSNVIPGMLLRLGSELVLVTGVSSLTLTVQRGVDGTYASAHGSGTKLFIATDQRGVLRPVTANPDIGAFD